MIPNAQVLEDHRLENSIINLIIRYRQVDSLDGPGVKFNKAILDDSQCSSSGGLVIRKLDNQFDYSLQAS